MNNPFDPGYYGSEELRQLGFRSVGDNVHIAKNCTIIGLPSIEIGNDVRIDGFTTIIANGGRVRFGNFIHIGGGCHFSAAADLTFGHFSGASQGVRIYTASDDFTGSALTGPMVPPEYRQVAKAPVSIGDYCILGTGSVVLPGGNLGEGCALGALSLVTKTLAPWGVYFGAPAKLLKARRRDLVMMAEALSA